MKFFQFFYQLKEYEDDAWSTLHSITIGAEDRDIAEIYLCFQRYPHHYIQIASCQEIKPHTVVVSEIH